MSVAQLTAHELGNFAALSCKLGLASSAEMIGLCETISKGNAAAWSDTYSDTIPIVFQDELIEAFQSADDDSMADSAMGPFAYNMISNGGNTFTWKPCEQNDPIIEKIEELERKCRQWQESFLRSRKQKEQTAVAYREVAELPKLSQSAVVEKCRAAGMQRVIVARFEIDRSDSQSDYWGSSTARTVVIGFGKGKRESFAQLRKAAAKFPPTFDFGPGKDRWSVEAKRDPADQDYRRGELLREADSYNVRHFPTREQAESAVSEIIETSPECQDGYSGVIGFPRFAQEYGVEYNCHSIENRENYSMGGGNYLGASRYSGWKVYSTKVEWFDGSTEVEFFELASVPDNRSQKREKKLVAKQAELKRAEQSGGTGHDVRKMNRLRVEIAALHSPGRAKAIDRLADSCNVDTSDIDVLEWL